MPDLQRYFNLLVSISDFNDCQRYANAFLYQSVNDCISSIFPDANVLGAKVAEWTNPIFYMLWQNYDGCNIILTDLANHYNLEATTYNQPRFNLPAEGNPLMNEYVAPAPKEAVYKPTQEEINNLSIYYSSLRKVYEVLKEKVFAMWNTYTQATDTLPINVMGYFLPWLKNQVQFFCQSSDDGSFDSRVNSIHDNVKAETVLIIRDLVNLGITPKEPILEKVKSLGRNR